jgi:hypothetical protein
MRRFWQRAVGRDSLLKGLGRGNRNWKGIKRELLA